MTTTYNDPHEHKPGSETGSLSLLLAMILTLAYAAVEAVAGEWSGSLALLGDPGHTLTDAVALLIALLATRMTRLPPSPRNSFGMARARLVASPVANFSLAG